jgi:hypothetical protein
MTTRCTDRALVSFLTRADIDALPWCTGSVDQDLRRRHAKISGYAAISFAYDVVGFCSVLSRGEGRGI